MHTLVIQHLSKSDPARFQVLRLSDGKRTEGIEVPSPVGFAVGDGSSNELMAELRWYLEEFLSYPFPPSTDRADRLLLCLRRWGDQAFGSLFGGMQGRDWFTAATAAGHEGLHLQVSSDDPRILAWPWEALRDPATDYLALGCQIERKLNQVTDPLPLPEDLPGDRINILLVTARPYAADVGYRSISRPLVELIESRKLPARVRVLRPPTFDRLREHLVERPHYYHILHFDGHGGYGADRSSDPNRFQGPLGRLVFENGDGEPEAISADRLSTLLREHRIPAVVLNACQSGMLDERAEDVFASVAASLVRAGVRSVVAMAYSLYVSGAEQFLPAYYSRLFDVGDAGEATRAGRQQMYRSPDRVCARGRYPLQDWLVPVVYQQAPAELSFAAEAGSIATAGDQPELPEEASDKENPYGFVGRDGALLAIERAMRRPPAGILIHGLGGVGKTTLARGAVRWLAQTEGLGRGCMWFTFSDIRNVEYVFNGLGTALFGAEFIPWSMEQKLAALTTTFKANPFVIVWDNFESARGIAGTSVEGLLSAEDLGCLGRFLAGMRGGRTKVLITSRSEEDWLDSSQRYKVGLGGLQDEERWEYCGVILRDLGLRIDRGDADLVKLMDLLEGHPLMMRVMLPRLEKSSAGALVAALQTNLSHLSALGDATQEKLFATLRFVEQSLSEDLRPLLLPLSLHERYVDADHLEAMARQVDEAWSRARIDGFLSALATAGLVHDQGQAIYRLHPALTGYLRSGYAARAADSSEAWASEFVDLMGGVCDAVAPRPLHEQRLTFQVHGANFHHANGEAERLGMRTALAALVQGLAAYALNVRSFDTAATLFQRLADLNEAAGEERGQAAAYHQLGRIAEECRDFATAEEWYLKSLAINEKQGNEHGAAITYHQLGITAAERRDFAAAEEWLLKSLAISEKQDDEHLASGTHHQLGRIAEERRDFDAAEKWYLKSLAISEKRGNEHFAAITYHQLGIIGAERRDFGAAEEWYLKSLAIKEKQGDEHGAAITYHQLGIIGAKRRDFGAAEKWYLKSLAIKEKQGDEHGAAITYHQLGITAAERRDFDAAEEWLLKSLAISEKQGNEHGAAMTYHQLGIIAQERRDFDAAEKWYLKSLAINEKQGNEHGAASTYCQLGILAGLREHFEDSAGWLIRSVAAFRRQRDPHGARRTAANFRVSYDRADRSQRTKLKAMWEKANLGPLPGNDK